MKYAFIKAHRSLEWTVVLMCEVLDVSKAGFYRWLNRRPTQRQQENASLLKFLLQRAHELHGIPGYRVLWKEAVAEGFWCNKKRVQRLLKSVGYRSVVAPKPGWRKAPSSLPVLPNLLNREFTVPAPHRVWVSDITQIRCQEGWLYVAVVLDLHSRMPVGWAAGRINSAGLVLTALKRAWLSRRPDGNKLLFHSDQGSQYRSEEVMGWLTRRGVTLSMSRRGNCWDNACAESFFALLKKEWVHPLGLLSREEMKAELGYYIDQFYPMMRRHGTLGGVTPNAFELAA